MGDGVFNASPVYLEFAQPDQTCYSTIKSELTRFFSVNSSRISSFTLWCVDRISSDKITDCEIVYEVSSENWIWFSRKPGIYIFIGWSVKPRRWKFVRVGGGYGGGGGVEGNKRKSAVKFPRYWSNLNAWRSFWGSISRGGGDGTFSRNQFKSPQVRRQDSLWNFNCRLSPTRPNKNTPFLSLPVWPTRC